MKLYNNRPELLPDSNGLAYLVYYFGVFSGVAYKYLMSHVDSFIIIVQRYKFVLSCELYLEQSC